jgi:hypothetical protein
MDEVAYVESLRPVVQSYLLRTAKKLQQRFFAVVKDDLRCPVTCASCETIYEGDRESCPCCRDSQAFGPQTHLANQVRAFHDLYRHRYGQ